MLNPTGTSKISIHAPRVGCDLLPSPSPRQLQEFQSTHPVWGATVFAIYRKYESFVISIHAPRVGCDNGRKSQSVAAGIFQSTHPVWGATLTCSKIRRKSKIFQSTHPVWGATDAGRVFGVVDKYFNPRPPCGVRRMRAGFLGSLISISIHAPRVGCDFRWTKVNAFPKSFQSTHPVWGATGAGSQAFKPYTVFQSTHPVWGATRS